MHLLPGAPEQVDAGAFPDEEVRACADLPHLLATRAVDVPVYFFADHDENAHQVRFVREFPGVLVLLSANVHRTLARLTEASGSVEEYRELLVEEHGESARGWPERFLWSPDRDRVRARLPLTGVLCRRSHVVLAPPAIAERLRRRHHGIPIVDLPEDPESAAAAILDAAETRRDIPPLPPREWPLVEVVTVAYNSRKIIEPGLRSIMDQDYPNLICTVVDNASADGTAEFVRERFPKVNLIASQENLGFAGGNNLAFARSQAKYVVLFNQDAIARRDFVR